MQDLADLIGILNSQLWLGFIVFLRVGAAVSLLPGMNENQIPMQIKLAAAVAFTFVVFPAVPDIDLRPGFGAMVLVLATEVLAGVVLGLGIRMFVLALQTAGAIAAQATSLSQILGGAVAEPVAAIGQILTVAGIALAILLGLHVKFAQFVIFSYTILQPGAFVLGSDLAEWGVDQVATAFSLAFSLAAPFVILSVLYNLALGAINKAMPQLMVAFVGAPVITAGGLVLLMLASPIMLAFWITSFDLFLADPFGARR